VSVGGPAGPLRYEEQSTPQQDITD
jgi:hypothetical protein